MKRYFATVRIDSIANTVADCLNANGNVIVTPSRPTGFIQIEYDDGTPDTVPPPVTVQTPLTRLQASVEILENRMSTVQDLHRDRMTAIESRLSALEHPKAAGTPAETVGAALRLADDQLAALMVMFAAASPTSFKAMTRWVDILPMVNSIIAATREAKP